jgi:hypothetical protein
MQDDVVPLDTPWTDKYGNVHKTLRWVFYSCSAALVN